MNVHKNARLTPFGRERVVKQVLERVLTPAAASAAAGVSLRTIYKWIGRYKMEGAAGLCDRRSRPKRLRCALKEKQRLLIERLRRDRRPYREIAKRVRAPLSTVARYVRGLGLHRLESLDPKPVVVRYEHKRPGELVHLDIKRLSRFWRPGHRVTLDRSTHSIGAGYEFLHVAVDDHARVAYCELYRDERGLSAARFLARLLGYYRRLGIKVARTMAAPTAPGASHAPVGTLASSTPSSNRAGRKPTARPSASSRRRYASGLTCRTTSTTAIAPRPCCLGCTAITGIDLMPAWITIRPSADSVCL